MKRRNNILAIFLCLTLLTGCETKVIKSSEVTKSATPTPVTTTITPSPTATVTPLPTASITSAAENCTVDDEEKIDITLYLFGPDDVTKPIEEKVISISKELYKTNLTEALNTVFAETDIQYTSAKINKKNKCLTVDISQAVADKFNAGSTAGMMLMNELVDTLLHIPGINSLLVTVDGKKDCSSDHYSFEGLITLDDK